MSPLITRAAIVYEKKSPLTAYNNYAVVEASKHSLNNSFWQNLYPALEEVKCYYGVYGLIHDNTVISIGSIAGTDAEPNLEDRMPKKN